MYTVFSSIHSIKRHSISRQLLRVMLVALLASQFASAEHFHTDIEQNADCTVCVYADNSPTVLAAEAGQAFIGATLDFQLVRRSENPLSPPSFNHHSRAPPAH